MTRPNIVLILADDLGYGDCSCYGQRTWETPNIDALAANGIRFTDFYTTSPVCSPARCSIVTGLHSGRLPIRSLRDAYLPDEVPTIARLLADVGYVTANIGKYGIGNGQPDIDPIRKGFHLHYGYNSMFHAHNYFPPFLIENGEKVPLRNRPPRGDTRQEEYGVGVAEVKADYSPDFIERQALRFLETHRNDSFFLYYCPTMPHANNEGGDTPDGMEVDAYGDFEDRDWKANEKGFARMVQRIDETVGRVTAKLDELGIREQTLIVFTSDNGPHDEGGHSVTRFDSAGPFRGYKRFLNEGGIRIPFIANWTGTVIPEPEGGERAAHIGSFPDLLATFCELAGADVPEVHDGLSFVPLLRGEHQPGHTHLYFEFEGQIAVRQGEWKYLRDREREEHLFHIASDSHEDHDRKAERPDLFARLKDIATGEHRDYEPTSVPGGPVESFLP